MVMPPRFVDESLEPDEVDLHVVVDLDAEVLLDGLDHQAAATEGICGVDPVLSVTRDVDPEIAWDRQHLHRRTAAVDPDEHDHIAPGATEGAEVLQIVETLPGVGADDQEGEGATGRAVEDPGDLIIGVGAGQEVATGVDEVESQTRHHVGQYQEGDDDGLDATRETASARDGVGGGFGHLDVRRSPDYPWFRG